MNNPCYKPTSQSQSSTQRPPLPTCPACGQLQCLCRPRFFAGQLLTEEDLNRLECYIVEKNKLHNRYLHGWGVVCGLEVVCNSCQNQVTVRTGYALSPCGEDIIVCKDETVDVCSLIQACRPVSPYPDCEPSQRGNDEGCQDLTDDWVLAICYGEKPSRGITALRGGSSSGSGCYGENSSCNAGGTKSGNGSRSAQPNPPPQCEPTLTCEGYFYRVYKAQRGLVLVNPIGIKQTPGATFGTPGGALVANILACLDGIKKQLPVFPTSNATPQQLTQYCCSLKEALRELLVTDGLYDCQFADKLAAIRCPDPTSTSFTEEWKTAFSQLVTLGEELLPSCFCSALLPPCPGPVTNDCVPLATITVRRRDCRIVQVCNLSVRKFAITLPNLGYWLSIFAPFTEFLHKVFETICCSTAQIGRRAFNMFAPQARPSGGSPNVSPASSTSASTTAGAKMPPEREFTTLLYQALSNPERGDALTLLALNALGATDTDGKPFLSDLENRNPLQFLLFNQAIAPLIRSSVPDTAGGLSHLAGLGAGAAEAMSAQAAELATLREMVVKLQEQVKKLSSRSPNK